MVIVGSLAVSLGLMAAFGVPFYCVSNAIPVILIAIGVADGVHILGEYYERMQKYPGQTQRQLVDGTMQAMWRPVLITSITDIAGFLAMGLATEMPPMRMLGIFTALGVFAAMVNSLVLLPAVLVLLKPKPSRSFKLDSGFYSDNKVVVESLTDYIASDFNAVGITANLAGRANTSYHWINGIYASHFLGLGLAFLAVIICTGLFFRSLAAGLFSVVPVAGAVLVLYGVMGFSGIWLAMGTSMSAVIALGLGVDFAVHLIHQLRTFIQEKGLTIDQALAKLYPSTGRPLLFNFATVAVGFSIFFASQVPPLLRFGLTVLVCVSVSFISSVTVLPTLIKLINPAFIVGPQPNAPVLQSNQASSRA